MPDDEVGWIRSARRILEQCRGSAIDKIIERKRNLLSICIASRIGTYLWMIIAFAIFHLKLLHAITYPLHSFLTKGIKSTVHADGGEIRLPRFSFYKVRGEVTMVFLALSAIWHCFSWPNPMSALQWNFSIRPQVNLKPQMSLVAKSHSAPELSSASCTEQMKTIRSRSETTQYRMDGKVDASIDVRLKNALLDLFLTVYDAITDSISLASEFAASMISGSRSKLSVTSDDSGSYLSAVIDNQQFSTGDCQQAEISIPDCEWDTLNDDEENYDSHEAEKENKHDDKLIVGPYRWLTWKLPAIRLNNEDNNDNNNNNDRG